MSLCVYLCRDTRIYLYTEIESAGKSSLFHRVKLRSFTRAFRARKVSRGYSRALATRRFFPRDSETRTDIKQSTLRTARRIFHSCSMCTGSIVKALYQRALNSAARAQLFPKTFISRLFSTLRPKKCIFALNYSIYKRVDASFISSYRVNIDILFTFGIWRGIRSLLYEYKMMNFNRGQWIIDGSKHVATRSAYELVNSDRFEERKRERENEVSREISIIFFLV